MRIPHYGAVPGRPIISSCTLIPIPRSGPPRPGSLRIPLAVLDHLPDLHGAELKVLLVLSRRQARGGGKILLHYGMWNEQIF